jgi:hypothetical protein
VHVRLYKQIEETGLYTCHIRVDKLLSGGMALGASGAAAKLGMARSTLESKIQSLNINKNNRFKAKPRS